MKMSHVKKLTAIIITVIIYSQAFGDIVTKTGDLSGQVISCISIQYDRADQKFAYGLLPGTVSPLLEGLCAFGKPGAPMLPRDTHKLTLPGKWNISGVRINVFQQVNIPGSYSVVPVSKLSFLEQSGMGIKNPALERDASIYNSNTPYPGRWVNYTAGYDGENTLVFVRVYPIQYYPLSGELEMLVSGSVSIYGSQQVLTSTKDMVTTEAKNIIITVPTFTPAAESLKVLHESWGVPTAIVYIDSIEAGYDPAPEPVEYIGYSSPSHRPSYLDDYDYELALRIIAFLRDETGHPHLESVLLLGDALDIPPSYYSYTRQLGGYTGWNKYVASDAFYSSPDYDLIPNYGVGRIAVNDCEEAFTVIQKLVDNYRTATADWFKNAFFTTGNPWFGTDNFFYYEGEMYTTDIHNCGYCDALNSVRSYSSEGGHHYGAFSSAWRSGSYGIFHVFAHGSGYDFAFDDPSDPRFGMDDFLYHPISAPYPIFFAGDCYNGMYDQELIDDLGSGITFAEAFMKGPGGGIMLVASTRIAAASADYYIEDYETWMESQRHFAELGKRWIQAIAESPENCGELFKNTVTKYIEFADMEEDTFSLHTFFSAIMHGDPALPLPGIDTAPVHHSRPSVEILSPPVSVTDEGAPVFYGDTGYVRIAVEGGLEPLYAKALHGKNETPVYLNEVITGDEYNFPFPNAPQYTSLRIEAADGKAHWLYMLTSNCSLVPDGRLSDWAAAAIPAGGLDPDDFTQDYLELTDLYAHIEGGYLYVGFPFFGIGDEEIRGYTLCIDSREGGAAFNPEGDAPHTRVNFPDRAPEYEMVYYIAYDYYGHPYISTIYYCEHDAYSGDWEVISMTDLDAISIVNCDSGFIEATFSIDSLNSDGEVAILVYSFPYVTDGSAFPSQDATPYNPDSYYYLTFTETPNELVNWVVLDAEAVEEVESIKPDKMTLFAYPSPFNSALTIQYTAPSSADVSLEVYNILGERVTTVSDNEPIQGIGFRSFFQKLHGRDASMTGKDACLYRAVWKVGDEVSSGLYFVRLQAGNEMLVKQVVLLK